MLSTILVDNESGIIVAIPYLNERLGIVVNQTAKIEHVQEIQRAGHTLKERVRAVWNTLPYMLINDMIVSLAYYACEIINMSRGVSQRTVYRNACQL